MLFIKSLKTKAQIASSFAIAAADTFVPRKDGFGFRNEGFG